MERKHKRNSSKDPTTFEAKPASVQEPGKAFQKSIREQFPRDTGKRKKAGIETAISDKAGS